MDTFEFDKRSCGVDQLHAATALYTAGHVVRALLKRISWPTPTRQLFDPGAGDGSFLVEALSMMELRPNDEGAIARILGWEIHPGAVSEARQRITGHLVGRGWSDATAKRSANRMVIEADFLIDPLPQQTCETVAGNPPYLRFAYLPEYFKDAYANLPHYARQDLLHAFLDRCSEILARNGKVLFVTADRWLLNDSASKLRTKLGQTLGISHLARLPVESTFYRPKIRRVGSPPRVSPVEVILQAAGAECIPLTDAAIYPDAPQTPATGRTLGDIATVSIAPWLGPEGIWVVRSDIAKTLPGEWLIPAVDTDNLTVDDRLTAPTRWAIRTRCDVEPPGSIMDHLRSKAHLMPKRKGNRPFWMPPETITLPLNRPSLIIPRIAKRLRAIHCPPGVLPLNHNLSVAVPNGPHSLDDIEKILVSDESQEWLKARAPRLEGGYLSITTRPLRTLAVPASPVTDPLLNKLCA